MKKHKNKIIAGVIITIFLAFIFWYGGDSPSLHGWTPESSQPVDTVQSTQPPKTEAPTASPTVEKEKPQKQDATPVIAIKTDTDTSLKQDKYKTDPIPQGKPVPVEPEAAEITQKKYTCILSVRCDTILNNIQWLNKEKTDIVPEDGIIYEERAVTFYEGESVFNVLVREMKQNKIHLEFVNTPIYNSAYIEGIANLYEFDCGELSGWMYKVNDWFPNYGCSRYQLKEGDRVEWVYTCDLGSDVGGGYSARNGNLNE